ncbi:MAG: hypothetical protein ACFHXK_18830 [bacterium]
MRSKLRDTFNLYAAARKRDLRERAQMREEIDEECGKFQYFPLYDPPEGEWHIFTLLAAIVFCLPLKAADKVLEPISEPLITMPTSAYSAKMPAGSIRRHASTIAMKWIA